ncbi:MAG: hypothetical protein EBS68_17040, partial [Rhodobacteraceae bacterium]|nr:hypothetical protein [Paracoccaceae bacterium]
EPPPPSEDRAETEPAEAEAIKLAMMPAISDAAERILLREINAVSRKKNIDGDWLATFYAGHKSAIVSILSPQLDSLARLSGAAVDVDKLSQQYAERHVSESLRRLGEGEKPDVWMQDRPAWIAEYLTEEVCR